MKRILSFFMVFVLFFNFVLPPRSEAAAPLAGALLANPETTMAVASLLATTGIIYVNQESLIAGVTDFLNSSAEVREEVYNSIQLAGQYVVKGIEENILPVTQRLYELALNYATGHTGTSTTVSSSSVVYQDSTYLYTPYNNRGSIPEYGEKSSSFISKSGLTTENIYNLDKTSEFLSVTNNVNLYPFVKITPTNRDWYTNHNNNAVNGISFNLLGKEAKISVYDNGSNYDYFVLTIDGQTVNSYYKPTRQIYTATDVFLSIVPQYKNDSKGIYYTSLQIYITQLVDNSSSNFKWHTTKFSDYILKCSTPDTSNEIFNIFTTYDEATGLYKPSSSSYAPTIEYSVYTPTKTEWDYNADEQVGIVLPSGSIDNYVGTPESVTSGELTTYTGEKVGELDWTSGPSQGEIGGGSTSGDFNIGEWLTGTGAGTLSGTLDNAFSNVNTKIDSLTNSLTNVFNPELSWQNSNFRWFDFIILFLDVILACIRLTIRFLVFVVTLTQIVATPLISNSHMLQGIDFLKNITIPETNFTIWGLLTSFATAMIGVSAFKFIKRKFRF